MADILKGFEVLNVLSDGLPKTVSAVAEILFKDEENTRELTSIKKRVRGILKRYLVYGICNKKGDRAPEYSITSSGLLIFKILDIKRDTESRGTQMKLDPYLNSGEGLFESIAERLE